MAFLANYYRRGREEAEGQRKKEASKKRSVQNCSLLQKTQPCKVEGVCWLHPVPSNGSAMKGTLLPA
jgi:hypothetical protein